MSEVAELRKEIAALKALMQASEALAITGAAVAEKPSRRSPEYQTAGRQASPYGSHGNAIADDTAYRQRQADERKRRDGLAAEEHRRATEGLPNGQFRDPFGIVRNRETGLVVEVEQRQKAAVAVIEEQMAEEHRARLDNGLSEEQLFDKPAARKRTRRGKGRKGSKTNGE